MVPECPYVSLVPSNASKLLVKSRALKRTGLSRLEECLFLPFLGPKPDLQRMKNKAASNQKRTQKNKKIRVEDYWEKINPDAAGIDIGARENYVCVPSDRDARSIQRFGTTTPEIEAMAKWLSQCRITTVAMEATGVYWIAPFQLLATN